MATKPRKSKAGKTKAGKSKAKLNQLNTVQLNTLDDFLALLPDGNVKWAFENDIILDPAVFCVKYNLTVTTSQLNYLLGIRNDRATGIYPIMISPCPLTSQPNP